MKSYEIQRYLHAWIICCGLPEPHHQLRPRDLKVLVVGFSHKDGTIQAIGPSHATPRPMVAFLLFFRLLTTDKGEKNENMHPGARNRWKHVANKNETRFHTSKMEIKALKCGLPKQQ